MISPDRMIEIEAALDALAAAFDEIEALPVPQALEEADERLAARVRALREAIGDV